MQVTENLGMLAENIEMYSTLVDVASQVSTSFIYKV